MSKLVLAFVLVFAGCGLFDPTITERSNETNNATASVTLESWSAIEVPVTIKDAEGNKLELPDGATVTVLLPEIILKTEVVVPPQSESKEEDKIEWPMYLLIFVLGIAAAAIGYWYFVYEKKQKPDRNRVKSGIE